MIDYSFSIQNLEYFLVVFTRISCFVFIVPFFSMNNTPRRFRVGLSLALSYLIYQITLPHEMLVYSTVLEYTMIIIKEGITGILIGLSTNICNSIVLFAGRMVDMEIGFAMVNAMDPTTKENATITGLYYQYIIMIALVISDLYQYIITALVETFTLIPVNGTVLNTEHLLKSFIGFMGDYINIGFRICLPVFTVILVVNVLLGILAKVSPQMNMFSVGMQIKILIGLGVMFLTVNMLPYVAEFIYTEMKTMMVSFVEAMMI